MEIEPTTRRVYNPTLVSLRHNSLIILKYEKKTYTFAKIEINYLHFLDRYFNLSTPLSNELCERNARQLSVGIVIWKFYCNNIFNHLLIRKEGSVFINYIFYSPSISA